MSSFCWNCRGAGKAATVRELRDFAKKFTPTVLCIVETQVKGARVEALANTLGYDNAYAIDSQGRSGGIGIFWNNTINVEILGDSVYHIDAKVVEEGKDPWRLTCVYGEAQTQLRHQTWDLLKGLASFSNLPWLCLGDFNEVLRPDEHEGAANRSNAQIQGFRDAVDVCMLMDLGYHGRFWTFEKKVTGGSYTRVRLDRAMATADWAALFPMAKVTNLTSASSDHGPILVQFEEVLPRPKPSFRYEVMWESHESWRDTISSGWSELQADQGVEGIRRKLELLSKNLSAWEDATFGSVRKEIKKAKAELERLRSVPSRTAPNHLEQKLNERLVELYHREELMWRQRSRIQWLTAGDRNTNFFHMRANMRRRKNMIRALHNALGIRVEDKAEMKQLVTDFYKTLYTTEGVQGVDDVLQHVPRKVTPEMNASLCAPYTNEEVKQALFQMFPTKAPGPDGFPAHFYQRHWDICGDEVTKVVLRIVRGEETAASINDTVLVLIPKVQNPTLLTQFRPISLCNVIYKIASKVVSNRLKLILPDIISKEQSAFVPGRLITDNIICAYECLHFMKRNRSKTNSFCALKLDMMKAYDRLEWPYLKAIMVKLGFAPDWIHTVMSMITSVSFSVLFNGERLESFSPSRGIRQGDPISPYLFLIAAEGLSCLLKHSSQSLVLGGIKVAPTAPVVNHLLFADDSLLLFKSSVQGANEVSNLLDAYCLASGQRVNYDKSSIFFSKGCPETLRVEIKNILNVQNESLSEKYLGLPTDVGQSKNGTFKYLRDRVWERIKGWMEKLLSVAGKEVLIKSVAQALPVFSMSCFRLPRGLCGSITSLIRQFWWGSKRGKRKPCWVAWDLMTRPKSLGGLGFRDIEIFNLALLSRQIWRLLNDPSSLSAQILKASYFPQCTVLEAQLGPHPSQVWRSILDGRDIITQGAIRRIGDGTTTNIWQHSWIPRDGMMKPVASLVADPPQLVSDLIDHTRAAWREDLLRQVFIPIDVEAILQIPLCTRRVDDFWAWNDDPRGRFSVRSAYKMIVKIKIGREAWLEEREDPSNSEHEMRGWNSLWNMSVPPKLRFFTWRLAQHSLPTGDVLNHRHMATTSACSLCGGQDSWRHSLLECNVSRCVWALSEAEMVEHMWATSEPDARLWLFAMNDSLPPEQFQLMIVTLWAIWSARRKAIHEDIYQTPFATDNFIKAYLSDIEFLKKKEEAHGIAVPRPRTWIPPPTDYYKLNVDAAVSRPGTFGAVGVVCRDERGLFMGASALVFRGLHNPQVLEALAVREALALSEDLYINHLLVASDCKVVVDAIRQGSSAEFGAIVEEIKTRATTFISCSFTHEYRTSNTEAHNLAKHALSLGFGRHTWLGQPGDLLFVPMNIMIQ